MVYFQVTLDRRSLWWAISMCLLLLSAWLVLRSCYIGVRCALASIAARRYWLPHPPLPSSPSLPLPHFLFLVLPTLRPLPYSRIFFLAKLLTNHLIAILPRIHIRHCPANIYLITMSELCLRKYSAYRLSIVCNRVTEQLSIFSYVYIASF